MVPISKEDFEAQATFRYAIRRFLRLSEKNARSAGITPQKYGLLLAINGMKGRDWATISEVAERLQVLHNAAVSLCRRAEQMGLITRTPGIEDRRQVCVRLTDRGKKVVNAVALKNRRDLERIREDIMQLFLKGPLIRS